MKKSSLLLTAGIALAVLIIIVSLFLLRMNVGRDLEIVTGPKLGYSGERITIPLDTAGIRSLHFTGGWQIQLSQGSGTRGELSLPVEARDMLRMSREGDVLYLSLGKNFTPGEEMPFLAELELESLAMFRVEGATDAELQGFRGKELELVFDGASNVTGNGLEMENLRLRTAGASNIDLSDSSFVNVELDLAGASNVEIHLDGGRLSGKIAGFGSVEYSGSISEQTVQTDGFAAIHQR
jgi:hypothetical protein